MSDIFEKIGSYQILTNLLPGAFLNLTLKFLWDISLATRNLVEEIGIYYFAGIIINCIGSLAIEPLLKKLHFLNYAPYQRFIKAARTDSKIDILSETNNYLRCLLTATILIPIICILQKLHSSWPWFASNWKWLVVIFLIVLFLLSYQKQSNYVRKRVEAVNRQA